MMTKTFLLALALAAPAVAQQPSQAATRPALDRAKQPEPGRTPVLKVPGWTKATLANGAQLIVAPKRDLPLVSVTMNFIGGSYQFETPQKLGVGAMTASMLSEGTT